MTIAIVHAPDVRLEVNLYPLPDLREEDFVAFCQANPDLRLERAASGEILIMPPEGGESGYRGQTIGASAFNWAKRDGSGVVFGSSTGFRLPDGATRSPDIAWVLRSRLSELSQAQKREFLPLSPDFAVEVRSPTDRLSELQAKMEAYIANGTRLGWLIDPDARTVYIYRPGRPVERLDHPTRIAGDPELPGFELDLGEVWEPGL